MENKVKILMILSILYLMVCSVSIVNGQQNELPKKVVEHIKKDIWNSIADWTGESGQEGSYYGYSAKTAGDVNGDGYSDIIIGSHRYDNGEEDEGTVFVYYGSASGASTTADWIRESNQEGAFYGASVDTAGDVNGDGYSDIIVGAPFYDNGEEDEGIAYVYYGSPYGLNTDAGWIGASRQKGASYGSSVGTAGDVNGDGYSDIIIGSYKYDNGEEDEGAAFVYYGSASGLNTNADWMGESDQEGIMYGISVGTAGDVNGDGYSDIIVGSLVYDYDGLKKGQAYVYYGSPSGPSTAADWIGSSNQTTDHYGYSVGTAGDVNGDGYSDIIVGAYSHNNSKKYEGSAFLYYGSPSGPSTTANWVGTSNQFYANYGISVGTAGDVNGDGYSDIIVGAYEYDNGEKDEGAVFLYYGSASGPSITADWIGEGNQKYAGYGLSVGTAGDVNGDGYSDIIVGAYKYDNGEKDEGAVFLYYGNNTCKTATLSNKWSLYIPQVVYSTMFGDLYIWLDLEYVTNQDGALSFKVVDYGNLNFKSKCKYSTLTHDLKLHVPNIEYVYPSGTTYLWANLKHIEDSSDNIFFNLIDYGNVQ